MRCSLHHGFVLQQHFPSKSLESKKRGKTGLVFLDTITTLIILPNKAQKMYAATLSPTEAIARTRRLFASSVPLGNMSQLMGSKPLSNITMVPYRSTLIRDSSVAMQRRSGRRKRQIRTHATSSCSLLVIFCRRRQGRLCRGHSTPVTNFPDQLVYLSEHV